MNTDLQRFWSRWIGSVSTVKSVAPNLTLDRAVQPAVPEDPGPVHDPLDAQAIRCSNRKGDGCRSASGPEGCGCREVPGGEASQPYPDRAFPPPSGWFHRRHAGSVRRCLRPRSRDTSDTARSGRARPARDEDPGDHACDRAFRRIRSKRCHRREVVASDPFQHGGLQRRRFIQLLALESAQVFADDIPFVRVASGAINRSTSFPRAGGSAISMVEL